MRTHRIAVIPGDGIGHEVIPEGIKVLDAAAARVEDVSLQFERFPWGCGYYLKHGRMLPQDGLDTLAQFDAILLGGVGMPGAVPEEIAVRGLILAIRAGFDQFANVRPVNPLPGTRCVLRDVDPADIDIVVIRENTEGMYMGLGGRYAAGSPEFEAHKHLRPSFARSSELALQTGVFSESGCRRVMEYAFKIAESRGCPRRVTSCTKANALNHGMTLWNDVFAEVAAGHPGVQADWQNVDAMAMRLVLEPQAYDVIVAPNLFGDIITDLTAALQGGLGLSPGANISLTGPSMFEPPHGTAPDIAGRGIANPIATVLTAAMMAETIGEKEMGESIRDATAQVVAAGKVLTPDMGGTARTLEVGDAIAAAIG